MATEVRVPTLGESVTEATVATWFKKPGDQVAVDDMLCELETDKVTVEVPSPVAGTLAEIVAAEGATVSTEALLAQINEGATASCPRQKHTSAGRANHRSDGAGIRRICDRGHRLHLVQKARRYCNAGRNAL